MVRVLADENSGHDWPRERGLIVEPLEQKRPLLNVRSPSDGHHRTSRDR
jgi:hypothetical protein